MSLVLSFDPHVVAQWVKHWTSKSEVAVSIPTVVKLFFSLPGVDTLRVTSASTYTPELKTSCVFTGKNNPTSDVTLRGTTNEWTEVLLNTGRAGNWNWLTLWWSLSVSC